MQGLPVIEVLVFAGERNVPAPWLSSQSKIAVREFEFRLECAVLGTEAVCWNLEAYRRRYQPSSADVHTIVDWLRRRRPGALILPPAGDAHAAHQAARAAAAVGLIGAELTDTLILTGWTPWGPVPQPNAYFRYNAQAEQTKMWAIRCHVSQLFNTDYAQYAWYLGRAHAAVAREWANGHGLASNIARSDDGSVGVELFQVETLDRLRGATLCDPIQLALAEFSSSEEPITDRSLAPMNGN